MSNNNKPPNQIKPQYKQIQSVRSSNSSFLPDDKLACFNVGRPEDMPEHIWNQAKETAEKVGIRLPQQVEQAAFYWYYMGADWDEIADKLSIPLGLLAYSAIFYDWSTRRRQMKSVRAGDKITRSDAAQIDLLTDIMVVTTALYKQQIAQVVKDPSTAKDCALIPKNFKDLMTLSQMLMSLQTKEIELGNRPAATALTVNIANLPSGGQNRSTSYIDGQTVDLLQEPTEDEKLKILRLLEEAQKI